MNDETLDAQPSTPTQAQGGADAPHGEAARPAEDAHGTPRDGAGTVLVLLHGFPVDHRMWDGVVDALHVEIPVLAPDLPGLGSALLPADGAPSLDASADAVAAVVRRAGHERALVAGLSMGGYVALALAERHPELVAGLALVDTKATADADDARANRLRVADEVETTSSVDAVLGMVGSLLSATSVREHPGLPGEVTAWIGEQEPAGVAWSQRAMAARPDRTQVLAGFDGPVVVVVGEDDTVTPLPGAQQMVDAASDTTLVVVPGAGHLSAVEAPGAVAEALAGLVRRGRERTTPAP